MSKTCTFAPVSPRDRARGSNGDSSVAHLLHEGVVVAIRGVVLVISAARMMFRTVKHRLLVCTLAIASLVLTGCGRRATEADCTAIMDRNVEVQMRKMNITDSAAITKKQTEIRNQFSESFKGCIGRRITDGMMTCVKNAESVDAIDKCMH